MGIRFSSEESEKLIDVLKNNVIIAEEIITRVSKGCDHLIVSLASGELQGAAYTAGKGLFERLIIPAIKKLQLAVDDIKFEIQSYEYAHSVVSEYGILDEEDLQEQLRIKEQKLKEVKEQMRQFETFVNQVGSFDIDSSSFLAGRPYKLTRLKEQIELEIKDIKTRIEKLDWFVTDVARYFSDSLEVLNLAIQGAVELNSITVDGLGNYYIPANIQVYGLKAILGVSIMNERSMIQTLQDVYGFSKETACDIQELIILMKIANMAPNKGLSEKELAIKLMILFASPSYGETDLENFQWDHTTGENIFSRTEFIDKLKKLGFSYNKAINLYEEIRKQHVNVGKESNEIYGKTDFAHMMVTGATELSNNPQLLANIAARGKTVKSAGWLGDASTIGLGMQANLGNDDYKADLDAVNIARRIAQGSGSFEDTLRGYYKDLDNGVTNRAKEFQTHYKLKDIISEINEVDFSGERNVRSVGVISFVIYDNSQKRTLNPVAKKFVNSLEKNSNEYIDEEIV